MPRQGDGSSNNGPFDTTHNVGHGVTSTDNSKDKTAPLPDGLNEHGAGIQGLNASGGQSQGLKQGPNVGQGGSGSSN